MDAHLANPDRIFPWSKLLNPDTIGPRWNGLSLAARRLVLAALLVGDGKPERTYGLRVNEVGDRAGLDRKHLAEYLAEAEAAGFLHYRESEKKLFLCRASRMKRDDPVPEDGNVDLFRDLYDVGLKEAMIDAGIIPQPETAHLRLKLDVEIPRDVLRAIAVDAPDWDRRDRRTQDTKYNEAAVARGLAGYLRAVALADVGMYAAYLAAFVRKEQQADDAHDAEVRRRGELPAEERREILDREEAEREAAEKSAALKAQNDFLALYERTV